MEQTGRDSVHYTKFMIQFMDYHYLLYAKKNENIPKFE